MTNNIPRDDKQHPMNTPKRTRAAQILRDAHFWIPVAVLLAGLAVLQWIR